MTKARRNYSCDLCKQDIPAGEEYVERPMILSLPWGLSTGQKRAHIACHAFWSSCGEARGWLYLGDVEFRRAMQEAPSP